MFDSDPFIQFSWTQPMCAECFAKVEPGRHPFRFRDPQPETCCACGKSTTDGIFYRIDPKSVAFPTRLRT